MDSNKNIFNTKKLKPFRKVLRSNLTSAEAALWNLLKNKKVAGRKFRRQHSIDKYIADFCCPDEMLIIELDGNVHGNYAQIQNDETKDNYLTNLGFTVLRFENKLVFTDPDYILNEIRKCFPEKE